MLQNDEKLQHFPYMQQLVCKSLLVAKHKPKGPKPLLLLLLFK